MTTFDLSTGRPVIDLDPTAPWAEWPTTLLHHYRACDLTVSNERAELASFRPGDEVCFRPLACAWPALGRLLGFPPEFVLGKLTPAVQSAVLFDRLQALPPESELTLVTDAQRNLLNVFPGGREQLTYAEVAQVAHDAATARAGGDLLVSHEIGGQMRLRLLTPRQDAVTPAVGDVLQAGLDVRADYGDRPMVRLYVRRLVCLNGMTANRLAFTWQDKRERDRGAQARWLQRGVGEALDAYDELLARAREMARTPVEGDPEEALLARADALGVPVRHRDALRHAYAAEPVATEWGLLNAVTRLGTHAGLPGSLGDRLLDRAGEWVGEFDRVTARLPRAVAQRVGAQILDE